MKVVHTSGKRKRAIARATLFPGSGVVRINSKLLNFVTPQISRLKIEEPLLLAGDVYQKVDISVKVSGGGPTSQADASRLAIARALVQYTKNKSLEKSFLEYDRTLLVADVRRKEPAKPNSHGQARAKVQKSYR